MRPGEARPVLVLTAVDPERLRRAVAASEFVWVDLVAPDTADLDALAAVLPLHPLAVADTREFAQRAKVDHYADAALIVGFAARTDPDGAAAPVEVHLHTGPGFLVTAAPVAVPALTLLHRFVAADPPRPEDAIVVRVLDALVSTLAEAVEAQGAALDRLEDAVLERTRREQLGEVVRLRRAIAALHRVVEAEHAMSGAVEETVLALPELDPAARPYLRDVADRLARSETRLAAQQTGAASLADTYFNANANRLTELSERLTVIATVLLPLTLVTSFFGQNFGWLVDHIDGLTSFLVFGIGGLVVTPAIAVAYLRRRGRAV